MKCMVCGTKVKNTDNICTNCGSNLVSQREVVNNPAVVMSTNGVNTTNNNNGVKIFLIIFLVFSILPFAITLIGFFSVFNSAMDEVDEEFDNNIENSTILEEASNPYGYWISDENNYFSINEDQTLYYYDYYYDLSNNLTFGRTNIYNGEEAINMLGGKDKVTEYIFNTMQVSAYNYNEVHYIVFYPNRMFKDGEDILNQNKPVNGYYELLFVHDYYNTGTKAYIYNLTTDKIYNLTRK